MSYLEEHYDEIFKKFSDEELLKDINSYRYGKGKLNKVLRQWFEECIFKCIAPRGNKSPWEALQNDEDIAKMFEIISRNTKFYNGNEIQNIKSFIRNGGQVTRKVANFCPKNARDIYFRYNDIHGRTLNCLDTSAGFGSRMSAVLLSGHNYYGIDPNKELYDKLFDYWCWLYLHNIISDGQECELKECGSETFIPEWENKMDVSFTSPPYFNLEIYANDTSASTTNYNDYKSWLEQFAKPTIDNTYKYLKSGGYAMINIKNLTIKGKQPLFDDWFKIFSDHGGFEFVEVFDYKLPSAKQYYQNCTYSKEEYKGFKEPVMSFRKV